jgi:hypothetical protein
MNRCLPKAFIPLILTGSSMPRAMRRILEVRHPVLGEGGM